MERGNLWTMDRNIFEHTPATATLPIEVWPPTDPTGYILTEDISMLSTFENYDILKNISDTTNTSIIAYQAPQKFLAPYPEWLVIILWLLTAIFSIETILGNLLVLMAYKLERNIRRQLSNKFIVSLAITDLIIGMEGFPLLTVYVVGRERWPLGQTLCQIWLCLDYTLCLVSILTVLLITVDRYGSVCYPAKYRIWQTNTRVRIFVVFSWIVPFLFFGMMIFAWEGMTGQQMDDSGKCYAPFLNDPYVNMAMYIVYYWTTLVAVSVLYRGIHTAAKTLEDKSKARERQTIALLLGQRCMAQVGVGMLFHSSASDGDHHDHEMMNMGGAGGPGAGAQHKEMTEFGHDSGYMTTTATTATTHTNTSHGSSTVATVYGGEQSIDQFSIMYNPRDILAGKSEFENSSVPIIITQSPPTSVSLSPPTPPPGPESDDRQSISSIKKIEGMEILAEITPLVTEPTVSDPAVSTTLINSSPIKSLYTAQRQRASLPAATPSRNPSPLRPCGSLPPKNGQEFSKIGAIQTQERAEKFRSQSLIERKQPNQVINRSGSSNQSMRSNRSGNQSIKSNRSVDFSMKLNRSREQSIKSNRSCDQSMLGRTKMGKQRMIHQDSGCSLDFYDDRPGSTCTSSMNSLYGDPSLNSVLEFGALLSNTIDFDDENSSTLSSDFIRSQNWRTNLNDIFRAKSQIQKVKENGDLNRTSSISSTSSAWTRSASTSIRSQYSVHFEPENQTGGNSNFGSTNASPKFAGRSSSLKSSLKSNRGNGGSFKKTRIGQEEIFEVGTEEGLMEEEDETVMENPMIDQDQDEDSTIQTREKRRNSDLLGSKDHRLIDRSAGHEPWKFWRRFSERNRSDVRQMNDHRQQCGPNWANETRKIDQNRSDHHRSIDHNRSVRSVDQNRQDQRSEQSRFDQSTLIAPQESIFLPPIIEEEKSTTTRTDIDLLGSRSSSIGSPPAIKTAFGTKDARKLSSSIPSDGKIVHLAVPSQSMPGFDTSIGGPPGSRKGSTASTASSRRRKKGDRDGNRSSWQSITSSICHVGQRRQTRRATKVIDDDDDSDGGEGEARSSAEDSTCDRKRSVGWLATLFNNPSAILHRKRKVTKAEKRARKAFRTITVIVGTFALFWSPYYIVATIYGFCQDCVPAPLFLTSYYLCYLNSSVNPFAYAFANRLFRKTFIRILKGDLRRT